MAIKIKGNDGDLRGTSKAEKKARANSFTARQNERVATSMQQQQNGFKGESLNDHGLPDGHVQVDRAKSSIVANPKFRVDRGKPDEFADGVKGIKLKPKTEMPQDATRVKSPVTRKPAQPYAEKLGGLSDKQLDKEVNDQLANEDFDTSKMNDGPKYKQSLDSLVSRKIKKGKDFGKFEMGTKGIKIKSKADKAK